MRITAKAKALGHILGQLTGAIRCRVMGLMALALVLLFGAASPSVAQSQFRPAIIVDGEVITTYQLSQRQAFLALLRAPGDIRQLAADQLTNEALQLREARKAGVSVDDATVAAGMDEFAARGSLSTEQLLQLFAQNGVGAETFRDFVTAGVTWREFIKTQFLPKANISGAEIDAAMAVHEPEAGVRVLLSEIVLPAGNAATRKASRARAERLTALDETKFGQAALRFSTGASRNNLGKMNWLDLKTLPPATAAAVRGLKPGETSRIVDTGEDLRLYFMRDREEVKGGSPRAQIDYAALLLGGGQSDANKSEAAKIREKVVTCDNLYPIARTLPPEQFTRETLPESAVPSAYRAELDRLDPGEISTRLSSPSGAMVVLMLCARGNETPRSLTREAVEQQLKTKRATTMAQLFIDKVVANARIETPGL